MDVKSCPLLQLKAKMFEGVSSRLAWPYCSLEVTRKNRSPLYSPTAFVSIHCALTEGNTTYRLQDSLGPD